MDVAARWCDAALVMHPTSFSCARCGMASPVDRQRCGACGARRFVATAPAGSARSGPAAAEAWEASRAAARGAEATRRGGSPVSSRPATRPVGPLAVVAWRGLHVVHLIGIAVAAVAGARLLLAAAIEDQAELLADDAWRSLDDVVAVAGGVLVASLAVAGVLVLTWGWRAGRNAARLELDGGLWARSAERSAGRVLVAVGLAAAWRWLPNGPEQLDRVVDLAAGSLTVAAVVVASAALQQLLAVVTTTELQRAEWLLRLEGASTPRPKRRGPRGDAVAG